MKLIKAYVRTTRADDVVRALRDAGAPGVTVSWGHGVGYGYEPFAFTFAPGAVSHAPQAAKLEVVCRDEQVDALLGAVLEKACTHCPGDGIVFVSAVEQAVRIRTGERDGGALHGKA